jgi:hypothetical protein
MRSFLELMISILAILVFRYNEFCPNFDQIKKAEKFKETMKYFSIFVIFIVLVLIAELFCKINF